MMQKVRSKKPYRFREIVINKTENISLSYGVNDHVYSKIKIRKS